MTEGRPRHRIARSRLPWRLRLLTDPAALRHALAVVVLAGLLAALVGRSLAVAERARARWGEARTVLVAARPLVAGEALDAAAVREVRWPVALVPAGALRSLPASAVAAGPLDAGVPLAAAAVEQPGSDGRRTLALPVGAASLRVEAGDRVDVWSVADPATVADGAEQAERVAEAARVVGTAEGAVTVAVDEDEVEATAAASASARLVLVGSGG